jgi:hypothetical protein
MPRQTTPSARARFNVSPGVARVPGLSTHFLLNERR